MSLSKLGPVLVLGVLILTACGNGNEDAMVRGPAPPVVMLGGGTLTSIHDGQAGSPRVKVDWEVDGAKISISYGRPFLKGRIVGESVEPLEGRIWRLGADEATLFTTDRDLMMGAAHVPAGEYTLWTIADGDVTELIINYETGQWGTGYDESRNLGRTPMVLGTLDTPAEQLILNINDGDLRVEWGAMVASVPILVH